MILGESPALPLFIPKGGEMIQAILAAIIIAGYPVTAAPQGIEPSEGIQFPYQLSSSTQGYRTACSPLVPGYQGGITYYELQQNGAMGNRVMIDGDGNAHICWMHSEDETFADRDIYYNAWEPASEDFVWNDGTKASGTPRAGYTTMGILSTGEAVVAFHHRIPPESSISAVVVDAANMVGSFSSPVDVSPGNPTGGCPIWPHMVVDNDDVIHVTAHVHWDTREEQPYNYHYLYYSRSTDGGVSFSDWESLAQNAGTDAAMAASQDGKTAVAWVSRYKIDGTSHRATHGNVCYVESTDNGVTWSEAVCVTADYYGREQTPDDPDSFTLGALATSIDCCYDENGNLHIGWGDCWRSGYVSGDTARYSFFSRWFQRMMHWSEVSQKVTLASGPYTQFDPVDENGDTVETFDMGFWGLAWSISRYEKPGLGCWNPQLAAIGNNVAFTWTGQWDSLDITGAGTINADIYASGSLDGGRSWAPVKDWYISDSGTVWEHITNLTDTHSPGAGIGASESEEYHSVYPWILEDGYEDILHVTYIHDLFAGNPWGPVPGISTANPVMYFSTPVRFFSGAVSEDLPDDTQPVILSCKSIEQPPFDVHFSHPLPEPGVLRVRNVTGQTVRIFELEAGCKSIIWDGYDTRGASVPAGVYFMEVKTASEGVHGKVTLIR